ncbi:MAG: TIGR03619 family F420-dependent LLM class oxidoreductase [Chloroflexi bacterium]|nr:TIGR03619 family F420-dependent LLM class oxidoreductase [Chloroflexota bacterium]
MVGTPKQYGLLLPHFGDQASREKLIKGAQMAEAYGFDSLWVRDHLVFHPHGMEGQDRTHVDPMITLSLVGAVTEKLILGTGSLIPYRNPIQTALLLASLEFVAGPGRVIAGFGIGTFDHEFRAAGLGGLDRKKLLEEQVQVMRLLWSGEEVSFKGEFYEFNDVDIHPSPSAPGSIPIWYCGNSPASVRRAVEYCNGWMPGRITLQTFVKRVDRMKMLAEQHGKPLPTAAAIPITSPGRTREEALAKVNWQGMLASAVKTDWVTPKSGGWNGPDDLEGALIAGPPDHIIEETVKYQESGLQHLVYDLRFRFEDWYDCLAMIGEEVLPKLRAMESGVQPAAAAAG